MLFASGANDLSISMILESFLISRWESTIVIAFHLTSNDLAMPIFQLVAWGISTGYISAKI